MSLSLVFDQSEIISQIERFLNMKSYLNAEFVHFNK